MIFFYLLPFFIYNLSVYSRTLPENSFSSQAKGTTVLNILRSPVSPKFLASGEAGSSDITPDNVFLNPASATNIIYKNVFYLDFQKINVDARRSDFYYLNMDLDKRIYGFYFSYIDYGDFIKTDEKGNILGSFSPSDYIVNFNYSMGEKDRFGLNIKYAYSDMVYSKITALLFDIGFNLSGKQTRYSFVVRNLGFIRNHSLPIEFDVGVKYSYSKKLSGFFDYKFPSSDSSYPCGGFEYLFADYDDLKLKLRGGVNFKNKSYLGWSSIASGGLGFEFGGFYIDYAFVPYSNIDTTHFLSIKFLYGKPQRSKKREKEFSNFMMKQLSLKKKISVLGFAGDNYEYGRVISNSIEETLVLKNYNVLTSLDGVYINTIKSVPLNVDEAVSYARKLGIDFAIFGDYKKISEDLVSIKMYFVDVSKNAVKEFEMNSNLYDIRNIVLKLTDEIAKNIY